MSQLTADRREFLRGSGALAAGLSLKYAVPTVPVPSETLPGAVTEKLPASVAAAVMRTV